MPRIRSIKPEFWTNEQVVRCSRDARLLFVGLWNFADDQGVIPASPRQIGLQVFPGDNLKPERIEAFLSELLEASLLLLFEAAGKRYFFITGWHHQRIAKKTAKYPAPPESILEQGDTSSAPVSHQCATSSAPVATNAQRSIPDVEVEVDVEVDVEKKRFCFLGKEIKPADHLRTKTFFKWFKEWVDFKQSTKKPWKHSRGPAMFLNRVAEYSEAEAIEAIQRALEAGHETVYPRSSGFKREKPLSGKIPKDPRLAKELEYGRRIKRARAARADAKEPADINRIDQAIEQLERERDQVAQGVA